MKASLQKRREVLSFSFDGKPPEHGQAPGQCGDCIDYPVTGIISCDESLSLETEGGFSFFHLMENHKEHGQVPGQCGDCIDYPVTGIISFDKSLSLETAGGFFFCRIGLNDYPFEGAGLCPYPRIGRWPRLRRR